MEKSESAKFLAEYQDKIRQRDKETEAGWEKASLVNGLLLELQAHNFSRGEYIPSEDPDEPDLDHSISADYTAMKRSAKAYLKSENREDLIPLVSQVIDQLSKESTDDEKRGIDPEILRERLNTMIE